VNFVTFVPEAAVLAEAASDGEAGVATDEDAGSTEAPSSEETPSDTPDAAGGTPAPSLEVSGAGRSGRARSFWPVQAGEEVAP
jgi:hypothetical protein